MLSAISFFFTNINNKSTCKKRKKIRAVPVTRD